MTWPGRVVRRALSLGVAVGLAVWSVGDRRTEASSVERVAHEAADEPSIYALDLSLVDQRGRTSKLADLRGHPLVATMVYTTCTSVCPSVTHDMKAVERLLPARLRAGVTFVMFTLDPGRDTPDVLLTFARTHQLDPERWRLFATSEENVRVLSAVLGMRYKPEDNGEIAHSALMLAIDHDGVVRHRQVGLGRDPQALIAALGRTGR
jgi:protein SCO1/2